MKHLGKKGEEEKKVCKKTRKKRKNEKKKTKKNAHLSAAVETKVEKLPLYGASVLLARWITSVHTASKKSRACDTTTTVPG